MQLEKTALGLTLGIDFALSALRSGRCLGCLGILLLGPGLASCGREPAPTIDAGGVPTAAMTVSWNGEEMEATVARIAPGFFSEQRLLPLLGRFPIDRDQAVVVLGYELWQRATGGEPAIIGRSLAIAGGSAVVVGILPQGASGEVDVWWVEPANPAP